MTKIQMRRLEKLHEEKIMSKPTGQAGAAGAAAVRTKTIQVTVPILRAFYGTIALDTGTIDITDVCLCKADNAKAAKSGNPSRDPLKQNGDTPTGIYVCGPPRPVLESNLAARSKFGPWKIPLIPRSGDCLTAEKMGGRYGIMIHGGRARTDGSLRPTYGCIRVGDDTIIQLAQEVRKLQDQGVEVLCAVGEKGR